MAALSANARSLAARTVHIKIHPTARTLFERREVLRVLERFGEVAMFRSFKYHPQTPVQNAFLTIFASESAAHEAINASPIRYRLISSQNEALASPATGRARDPTAQFGSSNVPPEPETYQTKSQQDHEKLFQLNVSTSNFPHERYLSSPKTNPLGGPYKPVRPSQSFIGSSLERIIPKSLWSAGLLDWETDPLKWRNSRVAIDEHESEAKENLTQGYGVGNEHRSIAIKVGQRERKRREKDMPSIMKGLWGLQGQGGTHALRKIIPSTSQEEPTINATRSEFTDPTSVRSAYAEKNNDQQESANRPDPESMQAVVDGEAKCLIPTWGRLKR